MKLVTLQSNGQILAGYIDGEDVVICAEGEGADTAVMALAGHGARGLNDWAKHGGRRLPLAEVRLLSPIPVPRRNIFCVGKNYYAHAAEFHGSGFDSTGKEAVPSHADHLHQGHDRGHRPGRGGGQRARPDRHRRLRGRTRRGDRAGRARHQSGRCLRPCLRLSERQRHDLARIAAAPQPVVPRQKPRHLLPDGPLAGHRRRSGRRDRA